MYTVTHTLYAQSTVWLEGVRLPNFHSQSLCISSMTSTSINNSSLLGFSYSVAGVERRTKQRSGNQCLAVVINECHANTTGQCAAQRESRSDVSNNGRHSPRLSVLHLQQLFITLLASRLPSDVKFPFIRPFPVNILSCL